MTIVVQPLDLGGDGLRVMVKDTLDVAGVPTRASSRALADAAPAAEHAEVVRRLLDAGCRLTGKTVLHELAFGTTGINHYAGTAPNPRYPGRIPGGSSSGSAAAVAAGLADFSLGTDTGGSVRVPACCCGVFGLKPSFGRVSRQGVMPTHSSLDCVGPFAATLPMLVRAMSIIDPSFQPAAVPARITVGVLAVPASPAVQAVLDQALQASGQSLRAVQLEDFQAAYEAGMAVINRETFDACAPLLEGGQVAPDVAGRLQAAGQTDDAALAAAEQVRQRFTAQVDAALQDCDVLALPTLPDFPLRLEEAADTRAVLGMTALVRPFNLSGHPAVSLPLGSDHGLPVGLQLVAAKGADEQLLAAAECLLQALHAGAH
ncbi:amidase family protein [Pseudomonas sp. DTU_2021_1001937_2_SI_NGA_ILE_001]|uniref:amidase n=1 Tax=Pseudomonas sp. DTU_2021_1001937_2_SI_NGA_ILE_001 TaxID=3077589 RepID=UPI0028FC26E2|nr:amidase family protein [Pseudomonas sp. DTU_2021_1001937_2_SI_NGA_ILE_001]WNW09875.1 amidase family protein [Pseudomonas sp. DTU_2021_1001937_2_SI_NGA_ILE_001]